MLIGFILFTLNLFAQNPTEDFWLCTNREGGKWHFAKAPYICDIYHFSDPDIAQINYDEYVFYDLNDDPHDPPFLHIQSFCDVTYNDKVSNYNGFGVLEELILGPHKPSGFKNLFDKNNAH